MIGGNLSIRNIPPVVARKTDVRQDLGGFRTQLCIGSIAHEGRSESTGRMSTLSTQVLTAGGIVAYVVFILVMRQRTVIGRDR